MASKQTYPCFACRKAGHEVHVFLDGKDEEGRTKYLNEDGTRHTHLRSSLQQQQQPEQKKDSSSSQIDIDSLQSALKANFDMINAKLDRLTSLLSEDK